MPKTKKRSYRKIRQQHREAKRSVKIGKIDTPKHDETADVNLLPIIEITDDTNEQIDVNEIVRSNRDRIAACIMNVANELHDMCINAFLNVLIDTTTFMPQDPLFYQGLYWYQRVNSDRDIQILYSGNIGPDGIGHWTCIYYDGSVVHVYDTLKHRLLPHQHQILNRLYGNYSIVYENVQIQPDLTSCGVFACAIATSLALGKDPVTERYYVDEDGRTRTTLTMRQHLLRILNEKTISPFPAMGITTTALSDITTIVQEQNTDRLKIQESPAKTYASVCQTVPGHIISLASQSTTDDRSEKSKQQCNSDKTNTTLSRQRNRKNKWWTTHKHRINKKRREEYSVRHTSSGNSTNSVGHATLSFIQYTRSDEDCKANCSGEKPRNISQSATSGIKQPVKRANYDVDADAIKLPKKGKYSDDPEPKTLCEKTTAATYELNCTRRKEKYAANAKIYQARDRQKYAANPEIKRARERKRYAANPEIKRAREKKRYAANPELKTTKQRVEYSAHPETKKTYELNKYALNSEMKKTHERNKYSINREINKVILEKVRHARKKLRGQQKFITTKNILKKYRHLGRRSSTITLLGSVEKYITILSAKIDGESKPQKRIEAEKIIKWCIEARKRIVLSVKRTLNNLKNKVEVCSVRAAESSDIESKIAAFCGESKHTGSSDPYYTDTAYGELHILIDPLMTTSTGMIANVLPVTASTHVRKSWACSELCVKPNSHIISRLEYVFQAIRSWKITNIRNTLKHWNQCSINTSHHKLGHAQTCYTDPVSCNSKFLPLQLLHPHFPQIRYFTRNIYELIRLVDKINCIDNALVRGDVLLLQKLSSETAEKASMNQPCSEVINLNEDEIANKYRRAFHELVQQSMDTPRLACVSCEKLCYRRDTRNIKKLRKPITGHYWSQTKTHIDTSDNASDYICKYCLEKFRDNKMPPTCLLNQLAIGKVPPVFSTLNDYEKILIQRAKAFQTVQRMGTVAKKNLPNKLRVQKVTGRTFHLPLPLEETLKKLPAPTDALNLNQELFVMVCGLPNKSKVVWSSLVNVKKIYETLVWLRENNPFYAKIELPAKPDSLLDSLVQDVEIQVETEEPDLEEHADTVVECNDKTSTKRRAILTQIMDGEDYYEQYTIYPISADRENKNATALYQMLKIEEAPLSQWNKYLDVMCFPDLYPYGNNGQHQDRVIPLREFDYIKRRLMSTCSAFRLNQQYLFYLLHDSNIRQLKGGIFHRLNVINPKEKMNAGQYLELMSKEQLEGNLTTIFAKLRNTDQYWRKPRNDLGCMVQNYGPATWFLTLSPSEWMWDDLAEYIRNVNGPKMAGMSTTELVARDPVSASRYLDNKFRAMLKFICSNDNPIGEVSHYFWRREYQSRGTQHFHMLVWIEDAPTIGKSSTEDVVNFISKHITCRLPDKHISPTLYRRVDTHQRHKHNDYCMRNKKTKKGFTKICRFGFPRPITNTLVIKDVAMSIAGRKQLKSKSRLVDLPRNEEEVFINDYNPVILSAWEGNMDMQFIGEKSTILNWYCTKYSTKPETSHTTDMFHDINSTKSLSSRLWSVAMRSLNNRECGALEAADTLLGIPLYGTDPDTTIKWLDVNQLRNKRVKPYKTVEKLFPGSTDIFYPSLIDDYYPNRPEELDSVHLYDYAKWYEITKVLPQNNDAKIYDLGGGLYLKKRQRGYLINHYKYNPNVEPEKYFHALLLLFKPWRDTDELKNDFHSYAEAFEKSKADLLELMSYHERLSDIQKGFDQVKELIEQKLDDITNRISHLSQDSNDDRDNPLHYQPVEANLAIQDLNNAKGQLKDLDVVDMISQLNDEQKIIFNTVKTSLISARSEPLRMFVSGAGGTGKSFLIKTIRCWTKQILGATTAVTAPTGLAAFNVDGLTVHRLFQLPVEHGGTPKYKELSDEVLKILRKELKDVMLFIIDEVSMISNVTLMYIHLRLTDIFDTKNIDDGWFGGKHILLMGDLLQLPPVNADSAYLNLTEAKIQKYIGSVGAVNLWTKLFSYDELLTNVRQQNDTTYQEILTRIRLGILTTADQQILDSRKVNLTGTSVRARLDELRNYINQLPLDTVCLFPTRNQCDILNTAMLAKIPGDEIELNAIDSIDCIPYLKKKIMKLLNKEHEDSTRTAGLAKTIMVKIGAKIMIRRNIDVSTGIINGTIGHVISVTRDIDTREVQSLTIALASGMEYTIERVSTKFEIMNGAFIFRNQFPLSLSYGITIHKSQGLTLNSIVIDIGQTVFTAGQAYVALSRVKSLDGLHLINFSPQAVKVQEAALVEYNRLRAQYKPELAEINITRAAKLMVKDIVWSVPSCTQNIQIEVDDNTLPNSLRTIVGMENKDNVSCYANATLQCIFHCSNIVQELIKLNNNDPLEKLAYSYVTSNATLDSFAVRELAGKRFTENIQQDAAEFLTAICEKSDLTRKAIEHQLITTIRCNNCGLSSEITQPNYILAIPVSFTPGIKSSKNLQDLLNTTLSRWTRLDSTCNNCQKSDKLQKTVVALVKHIIVVQFMIFTYQDGQASKITNFKLNAVPTTKITLDNKKFKANSAIFHHGESIDSGHYTAMLKDKANNWLGVDDTRVRKQIWPRGAKDTYMMVFEAIS